MGGFFGLFDYSKPGPGVDKDAPPKGRIKVFFGVYSRKFWNLIKINLLFFLFNLPAVFLAFFMPDIFFRNANIDMRLKEILWALTAGFILSVPILTVGPAQAGFTYILRNYAREEHAFIWGDFKENALKNLKESIIISIVDFIVLILIGNAVNYYMLNGSKGIIFTIAAVFIVLSFVIFMMMHIYIYPMLVTFKLGVKEIYKNAMIFSLLKFGPNLCILLLCLLVMSITIFASNIIGYILFPFITMSTIGLITNFYAYPTLKKYMIDKATVESTNTTTEESN